MDLYYHLMNTIIFTLMIGKIFSWTPKIIRKVATSLISDLLNISSHTHLVFHILGEHDSWKKITHLRLINLSLSLSLPPTTFGFIENTTMYLPPLGPTCLFMMTNMHPFIYVLGGYICGPHAKCLQSFFVSNLVANWIPTKRPIFVNTNKWNLAYGDIKENLAGSVSVLYSFVCLVCRAVVVLKGLK